MSSKQSQASRKAKRQAQGGPYKYTQTYNQSIQVLGDNDPSPGARGGLTFTVASLGNYAALAQLYDLVRVTRVRVEFLPSFSETLLAQALEPQGGTNPIYRTPYVHSAIDYSNVTSPGTATPAAVLEEYGSYVRTKGNVPHVRVFKPAASLAIVQPGSTSISGSAAVFDQWYDTQTGSVQLSGLRYCIDSPSSETLTFGTPLLVNVKITLDLEFKNVI